MAFIIWSLNVLVPVQNQLWIDVFPKHCWGLTLEVMGLGTSGLDRGGDGQGDGGL